MDYILGVFPTSGFVVKTVYKQLYKLVKFQKLHQKKDKFLTKSIRLVSSSHRLRQTLPLLSKIVEEHDASTVSSIADPQNAVAWGGKVSPEFKSKVIRISKELKINPNHLMACMAFETAETFSPSIKNGSGSGATGLIQFMPSTAESLGVNTKTLARMSALEQLDYVKAYYWPYRNKINSLEDAYMAILYPAAIGKPPSFVLFRQGSIAYRQNAGIDRHNTGKITLNDVSYKVRQKLEKGLQPNFMG
ncbi:transglycosylase SLT domain-containing protein [Vibrio alginolyticus]|uniref:transglycosylase SLT domain-containing protein n=1 Tax=Vibrio alginolyticus TaxID=663 RepID=UPI001BD4E508|nr:transglycosylase SLT domain-containing protein [Vibrio alginolyticus]EGQ9179721.1 transglycosylase SLT domain-containing protein [Vibrio alginolyticus]MBS9933166.1 transglycosylase SLT domain-containing protein [Vibrio alginolyticus]